MVSHQPDMSDEELISLFIHQYADSFAEQVEEAGGWPVSFTFPEPQNDTQREAFRLFIGEIERATGQTVRFTSKPGSA
jgi:hypothetical protein